MRANRARAAVWVVLASISFGSACSIASAENLPKPSEFYFDEDRGTTRLVVALQGEGDALVDRLVAQIQRDPQATEERAQLAHLAMEGGRRELADQLYQAALARMSANSQQYRGLVWNYGWDLYHAGDAQGALDQWSKIVNGRPTGADWLPPTLALALWKLGRKDEAVAWFAAAVRTWPNQWNSAEDFARLLPQWRDEDRADLVQVLAAWQANPPAWP